MVSVISILRLDGVEFTHDARSREVAGVAVSGLDGLAGIGVAPQPDCVASKRPPFEHCGGALHLVAITNSSGRALVSRALRQPTLASHATKFLDSG